MPTSKQKPQPILASQAPQRKKPSSYPEPFASRMSGRVKHPLGDLFGISKYGVNLTELAPQSESALLHRHTKQEEFVYVISGTPTLVTEASEVDLKPGMCVGFTPAMGAHKIINRSDEVAVLLEVGDRESGDEVSYPADDLMAVLDDQGQWRFQHKDGRPY